MLLFSLLIAHRLFSHPHSFLFGCLSDAGCSRCVTHLLLRCFLQSPQFTAMLTPWNARESATTPMIPP